MIARRKKRELRAINTEANPIGSRQEKEIYDEIDENDFPEDLMIGIPLNQKFYDLKEKDVIERTYQEKYTKDKQNVLEFLRTLKGLDDIRRARFLFISVQTYGNVDGICIPAEIALCEFNLKHGIIDKYTSIIGPWRLNNEMQRRRAEFHASETHQIHLNMSARRSLKVPTQNSCLREILGRCEPTIAQHQGVSVGLYRNGIVEFENDVEYPVRFASNNDDRSNDTSDQRRATSNCNFYDNQTDSLCQHRRIKINKGSAKSYCDSKQSQPPQPIFVSDKEGRRWLVCLNHEYEYVRASLNYLAQAQGLCYDGFPTTEDRFWFADAVVDALAEYVNGEPNSEYKLWLDIFGRKQPFEFNTPWERRADVFCRTHSITRNCCCALATAIRSCFAMFFALREPLNLTFGE